MITDWIFEFAALSWNINLIELAKIIWVLIGLVTTYFAKFILIFIGVVIVIFIALF